MSILQLERKGYMKLKALVLMAVLALSTSFLTACGAEQNASAVPDFKCGEKMLKVTITVNQWSSLVTDLGSGCVEASTILSGTTVDPHDYEATPNDLNYFKDADLIVANGAGYDEWAEDLIPAEARVLTASAAAEKFMQTESIDSASAYYGVDAKENPHLWFSPAVVQQLADNISETYASLFPDEESQKVIKNNKLSFDKKMKDLKAKIEKDRDDVLGYAYTYAATESVSDYLFQALGYQNVTPEGYANAASSESEASPEDVNNFLNMISSGEVSVLAVNTQELTPVAENLKTAAEVDGVRIVEVSEMVPNDVPDIMTWLSDIIDRAAGREIPERGPGATADEVCSGEPPVCTPVVKDQAYQLNDSDKAMIGDAFNPQ